MSPRTLNEGEAVKVLRWIWSWKYDVMIRVGVVYVFDVPVLPLLDVRLRFYQDQPVKTESEG